MTEFKIVTVGKDENQRLSKEEIEKVSSRVEVHQVSNNKKFLPKIYNEFLEETRQKKDCQFLIFMHADVSMDLKSLLNHIEACKDKYDVMGLCGTSILNVSQSPLNWWTGSNPTPQAKWGCVTHGELGNQESYFSIHSPDVLDHEVACIDGLCIIFGPKAIASQMKFDEMFQWDLYDTDISWQAILTYGLKLGVIVERSLHHYSVGRGILGEDFLRHEIDFRKKWNLEIPSTSPINRLVGNH